MTKFLFNDPDDADVEEEPPDREGHFDAEAMADPESRPPISASRFVWVNPASIPRRRWLYSCHYAGSYVSITVAQPGVGKSSLAMVEGLAITTGRPLLGVPPDERVNVWYWNGEDPMDELQRRITAAMLHYRIAPAEIRGRLFVDTGRETKIIIAEQTRTGAVIARPVVDAVIAEIKANDIGLLIIDPFVASHRVVENDNPAIEQVAQAWAEIADVTGCAIELVHHSRKTGGADVTVEDGRGGSALLAKARSARTLNVMSADDAETAGVESPRQYFRVTSGKSNMAPPVAESEWYRLQSVELGNGDSVGVVTRWTWPDALHGVTVADLRAVQAIVAKGRYRQNAQAKDWVGNAVAEAMSLDVNKKADRRRISRLLKTWTAKGMFVAVEGEDEKRRKRWFVEVGERAHD
jgi:AAA domain